MLALGLEQRMVGTAYLDDEILPEFREEYESVPVLAEEYPSREVLLGAEPDFVFGGFSSVFESDAAGNRKGLHELGIDTYLMTEYCPRGCYELYLGSVSIREWLLTILENHTQATFQMKSGRLLPHTLRSSGRTLPSAITTYVRS